MRLVQPARLWSPRWSRKWVNNLVGQGLSEARAKSYSEVPPGNLSIRQDVILSVAKNPGSGTHSLQQLSLRVTQCA
jgi:hypothetical protein